MHELKISGHSDDVIDVSGQIEDEFNPDEPDEKKLYVAISDGTLLSVAYDQDGCWRFNRVTAGTAAYLKVEAAGEEYSDVVTLNSEEPFHWVAYSEQVARK